MSNEINTTMIRLYYANSNSAITAMRAYRKETGVKCPMNEVQIRRLIQKFEETQNVKDRRPGSGRPSVSSDTQEMIIATKNEISSNHP